MSIGIQLWIMYGTLLFFLLVIFSTAIREVNQCKNELTRVYSILYLIAADQETRSRLSLLSNTDLTGPFTSGDTDDE